MRAAAVALLLLLVAGCAGGGANSEGSRPAPAAGPPETPSTTKAPTETASPATQDQLFLLRPPCAHADGVRISSETRDGGGGQVDVIWKIRSRVPCTLEGRPSAALLDADGDPLAATYTHDRRVGQKVVGAPVGPRRFTTVAMVTARCDVASGTQMARSVRLDFHDGVVVSRDADEAGVCVDARRNRVSVSTVGTWALGASRFPRHVAFPIGSSQVLPNAATWGRADIDGDGSPDLVTVARDGTVQARLGGGTLTASLLPGGRLQALADLDRDGAAEVLVGYTAAGCCPGSYAFEDSDPAVLRLADGRLQQVEIPLAFATGRGDVFAGVACGRRHLVISRAFLKSQFSDHSLMKITRAVWKIDGAGAHRVGRTTVTATADPLQVAASSCPGMGTNGWGTWP